jgi:hypothetical protein
MINADSPLLVGALRKRRPGDVSRAGVLECADKVRTRERMRFDAGALFTAPSMDIHPTVVVHP